MSDTIRIEGLKVAALIGVFPHERGRPRPLTVDVALSVDLRQAGASDALADTVDYGALAEELKAIAAASSYALLESLAEEMATACLSRAGVMSVEITIRKGGAVPGTTSVAVTISRP